MHLEGKLYVAVSGTGDLHDELSGYVPKGSMVKMGIREHAGFSPYGTAYLNGEIKQPLYSIPYAPSSGYYVDLWFDTRERWRF